MWYFFKFKSKVQNIYNATYNRKNKKFKFKFGLVWMVLNNLTVSGSKFNFLLIKSFVLIGIA